MRSGSWKCPCGVTVRHAPLRDDEDPEAEGEVVELDGVVHVHGDEDEEDDDIW